MTLCYLDIETTGLSLNRHQVWEVAWAVDDGEIHECVVPHSLTDASPVALKMNGYLDRVTAETRPWARSEDDLKQALEGATIVGANPAFDTSFLRARWGLEADPWKYRLFDIEAYAMPALTLGEPKGLAYIAEQLGVQAPDHSAAGDVNTLRQCLRKLRVIYGAVDFAASGSKSAA